MGVAPDPPVFWGWTDWHGMSLPCTWASSPPPPAPTPGGRQSPLFMRKKMLMTRRGSVVSGLSDS